MIAIDTNILFYSIIPESSAHEKASDYVRAVTPEQPGFGNKMRIADDLMRRYRNALRELAQ